MGPSGTPLLTPGALHLGLVSPPASCLARGTASPARCVGVAGGGLLVEEKGYPGIRNSLASKGWSHTPSPAQKPETRE